MPPSRRSIRCFISIPTAKNPDLAYTVRRRSNLRLTRVLRTFSKIIRKLELVQKEILKTDFRITLARVTNDQELAKIDPDTGLQQDVGPSIIRSVTFSARRSSSFGYVQGSFARATAVNRLTGTDIPEAPRLIWELVGGANRLPLRFRARSEFEYVGRKPLDSGFTGSPVREIRGALFRSFQEGRFDAGVNFLLARGFTGQTVETLHLAGEPAAFPRVVGVRVKSYVGLSFTYHFGPNRGS